MRIRQLAISVALTGTAIMTPALAEDAYVIGLSGAITGPFAASYAPSVESLKMYIEKVNENGGVNGNSIRLVVRDNQGNPSHAASDTKDFTTQEDAVLLVNVGPSSTYGPMIAESIRSKTPLLFAGAACPDDVFPPKAAKFQFCSISASTKYDAEMALGFIKEQENKPINLGMAAMAIPVSRAGIDYVASISKQYNITPVDQEMIPPTTANYAPFAFKLKEAKSDWVYSWAPWITQIKTFESLRKIDWKGKFIAAALIPAEDEMVRVKDDQFYVVGANAMFTENLPIHQEIIEATKGANITYPVTQLADGWIAGMVIEQALKKTASPVTSDKLLETMNTLEIDTKGMRGGPIVWTKTNHFRTKQYSRVYHWDDSAKSVKRVTDWAMIEVK